MSAGLTVAEIAELQVAAESQFGHLCTIVRTTGSHGWDDDGTDTAHLEDQPCYYAERVSREFTEVSGVLLITTALLFLPRDVNVAEGDRVTVVTDQTGAALITASRGIDGVVRHPSHIECVLEGTGT